MHILWMLQMFSLRVVLNPYVVFLQYVKEINQLMGEFKQIMRSSLGKLYSHDLLNIIFSHPYTKVSFLERNLMITNKTAGRYLDKIAEVGLLKKEKIGRENFYINTRLMDVLAHVDE